MLEKIPKYFTDSKFLVIGGDPRSSTKTVEFFDLIKPYQGCTKISDFPKSLDAPSSAFVPNVGPVVCAGWDPDYEEYLEHCYHLNQEGKFQEILDKSLKIGRRRAVSVVTPSGDLWILGGAVGPKALTPTNSTELIPFGQHTQVHDRFEELQPKLPLSLSLACITKIDDKRALLTGGLTGAGLGPFRAINATYVLDLVNFTMSPGPIMNHARFHHGCSSFEHSNGKTVTVVVGGTENILSPNSMEILYDTETSEWLEGNSAPQFTRCSSEAISFVPGQSLPICLPQPQMINTDIGPMVIGRLGYSQNEIGNPQLSTIYYLSIIYYLSCENGDDDIKSSCNWTLFNQSLIIPRGNLMVIPIDDSYAEKIHKTYLPQYVDISTSPVSKFLVIGGSPKDISKDIEFIDLKRPDVSCDIPDLPSGAGGVRPTGAFTVNRGPVVCTGWDPPSDDFPYGRYPDSCLVLNQKGKFQDLNEELCEPVVTQGKWDAVSVATTYGDLWILGGGVYDGSTGSWNKGLASTQLIQLGNGPKVHTKPEELLKGLMSACLAKINSTTAILIGGTQKRSASPVTEDSTYYLNLVNLTISSGPKMKQSRYDHGCGTFQFRYKTVIIVAGGHIDDCSLLSSTEYLMDNEWHEGEFLGLLMKSHFSHMYLFVIFLRTSTSNGTGSFATYQYC